MSSQLIYERKRVLRILFLINFLRVSNKLKVVNIPMTTQKININEKFLQRNTKYRLYKNIVATYCM